MKTTVLSWRRTALAVGIVSFLLTGSIEWTTFFTLRWFFTTDLVNDEVDSRLQAGLVWDITDDLDNQNVGGDYGGGGGNSTHWTFTSQFAPAIRSGASLLAVSVSSPATGQRLTVAVPLYRRQ